MIGKTISHYRILKKLGEGGMGIVYEAQDTKLDRAVVLKFLPEHLLRDEEAKRRFVHEAKAASVLNHPNITTIHEIDEIEDQCFISMELVEGKSIKELSGERALPLNEILGIAVQVCDGLVTAHERGIVHRDIKSANIMVTTKGQAKIMDFGLAKSSGQTTLTKTDTTMGTVAYMSPEQARGETVDHRTDIWSLGIVLYEMMTGQLPFKSDYEQAVVYSILNESPQQITELRKDVPESLSTILSRALEKDPGQRYQSTNEMLIDLHAVKNGLAVSRKPKIRRKRRAAILISITVAFAMIVAVLLMRPAERPIPRKVPIGVMFFDNQTGEEKYDYLRKVLADMLITDLSQSRYLQVLTLPRMFDLLRSLGYEEVKVIDASVGFELCKLAGASVMVLGSIMKSGNTFVLNTQVLDVDTKELMASPYRVTGEGEGSILGNLVDDLTDNIKRGLEISVREIQREKKDIRELTTTSLEAYKYYVAGREAAFRMRNQEAIDNFEKAVALDSAFIEAHDALARQYYTIGENTKALEIIEKVKSLSAKLTEQKLVEILALEAYIKHDWDLAIKYYKRLTSMNPEDLGAHLHLGMIYYQDRVMYQKGISEFEKVLELDREGVMYYSSLSSDEREKKVSFTYNVLGWAYLRKGEFKKAHEAFEKYVALLPNQVYALNVLAEFYLAVGNYDGAITNLQRSTEINPDDPIASALLGDAYLAKGVYSQALACYEKYLAFSTSEVEKAKAYFSLGKLYYLQGDYPKAIQKCQQALELEPKTVEAHWIQGLAFVKRGMFDQAESEALTIKELVEKAKDEDSRRYLYHLVGELSLSKGVHQQAVENLSRATLIWSLERNFFINALGEAYFEAGELDKAIEKSEVVLETNPNYAETHYLLGLVYSKKGKKQEARQHFQKFVEIWKDADRDLPRLVEARRQLEES